MKYIEDFGMMWGALALIGLLVGMVGIIAWVMWQWVVTRVFVILFIVAGILALIFTIWEYFHDKKEEAKETNHNNTIDWR